MDREKVIELICQDTGLDRSTCETILGAFEKIVYDAALRHEGVNLSDYLGSFFVQEHIEKLNPNSPRTMPKAKYSLMFRASNLLKKELVQSDADFLSMLRAHGYQKQADVYEKHLKRNYTKNNTTTSQTFLK